MNLKTNQKITKRNEEEKQKLIRRLNIISGQVNGLQQMVTDDRYCADILMQIYLDLSSFFWDSPEAFVVEFPHIPERHFLC